MGYIKSYSEVTREIESIKNCVKELKFYDWEEIMEFVPNSDGLKIELQKLFDKIEDSINNFDGLL